MPINEDVEKLKNHLLVRDGQIANYAFLPDSQLINKILPNIYGKISGPNSIRPIGSINENFKNKDFLLKRKDFYMTLNGDVNHNFILKHQAAKNYVAKIKDALSDVNSLLNKI